MTAPSPTTLDLIYQVFPTGPVSIDDLAAALAAVPLSTASGTPPFSDLVEMGLTPVSDVTTTILVPVLGPAAQRDLQFSLLPPFVPSTPASALPAGQAPGTFQGSLVSSSPNDVAGGSGCQKLRIDYVDENGVPQNEFVVPTGTAPVNLLNNKKVSITNIAVIEGTAPAGLIYVYSGLGGSGLLIFEGTGPTITPVLQNFQGSIVSSSPADNGVTPGVGAQTVRIHYTDALGAPQAPQVVTLNGTTPVDLLLTNHAVLTAVELVDVGATGSSCGIISIMTGTKATGGLAGYLGPSFFQFYPQFMTRAQAIVPPVGYGPAAGGKQTGHNWQLPGVGGIYQGTPGNTGLDPTGAPAKSPNLLDGEVTLVNGSPNIVFDTAQVLGKGTTMTFSSQPDVVYTLSASIAGTHAVLTGNYTGNDTTTAVTTLISVPSDMASRFRGIYTQIIGAALVSKVVALEPAFS